MTPLASDAKAYAKLNAFANLKRIALIRAEIGSGTIQLRSSHA